MDVLRDKRFVIAWPLVCLLAALGWVEYRMGMVGEELAIRPAVAVVAQDEFVLSQLRADPSLTREEAYERLNGIGGRLASAGYLVLNDRTLVAYPAAMEVKP